MSASGFNLRTSGSESSCARAASPLGQERTARMSLLLPRRRNVRAAAKPRPVFAPVMRMVLAVSEVQDGGAGIGGWVRNISGRDLVESEVVVDVYIYMYIRRLVKYGISG